MISKSSPNCVLRLVLDDFEPSIVFTPYYPSKNKTVDLGNRIKPKAVASSPDIYASGTVKPNITYTLVLTDPDATSRAHPIKAQMCHWIVTNITAPSPDAGQGEGFDLGHVSSLAGQNGALELEPYFPPSPPPKTGYHRYVFVVLASKSGLEIPKMPKKRPHWGYGKVGAGVREWAFDNKLSVIGELYEDRIPHMSLTR